MTLLVVIHRYRAIGCRLYRQEPQNTDIVGVKTTSLYRLAEITMFDRGKCQVEMQVPHSSLNGYYHNRGVCRLEQQNKICELAADAESGPEFR